MEVFIGILGLGIIIFVVFLVERKINGSGRKKADRHVSDDDMINIAAYRKSTGRNMPSYEDILKMNEKEFLIWCTVGVLEKNRDKFLTEMVDYEEQVNSLNPPEETNALGAEQIGSRMLWNLFHKRRAVKRQNC